MTNSACYEKPMFRRWLWVVVVVALGSVASTAQAGKAPRWVDHIERPAAAMPTGDAGSRTQLRDVYVRFDERWRTSFHREVFVVVGESEIDATRKLTFERDADIHYLDVIRDGKVVTRLRDCVRKPDDTTLDVEVPNLQSGDQIDYAYSVREPAPDRITGTHSLATYLGGTIDRWRLVLIVPASTPLGVKVHGPGAEPTVERTSRETFYRWDIENLEPTVQEPDAAAWYAAGGLVQYTDMQSWAELGAWLAPKFSVPAAPTPGVAARAKTIADKYAKRSMRAVAAARFVQHELGTVPRFVPIQDRSFVDPDVVLETGGGDSYEKARTLVAILRALNIEADVALASQSNRGTVGFWLAGPEAFDTALVRYQVGKQAHWIDPTDDHARGTVPHRLWLERALLLAQPEAHLEDVPMPRGDAPNWDMTYTFTKRDDGGARVDVEYAIRGMHASYARMLADPEEIGAQYLLELQSTDSDATLESPMRVEDDTKNNVLRVVGRYQVPTYWRGGMRQFGTFEIASALGSPELTERKTPMVLGYPLYLRERLRANLPTGVDITSDRKTIDNRFFTLKLQAGRKGAYYDMVWTYRSKVGHVMPEEMPEYLAALAEAQNMTAYFLSIPKGANGDGDGGGIPWRLVIVGLIVIGSLVSRKMRY